MDRIRIRIADKYQLQERDLDNVMSTIADFTRTFEATYRPMYSAISAEANLNYMVKHGMPVSRATFERQLAQSQQELATVIGDRPVGRSLQLTARDFGLTVEDPELEAIVKNYDDLGLGISVLSLDAALALNTELVFSQLAGDESEDDVATELRRSNLLNCAANTYRDRGPGIQIPLAPIPGVRSSLFHEMTHFKNDSRWDYRILVDIYVNHWKKHLPGQRRRLAELLPTHPHLPTRMENYVAGFLTQTTDPKHRKEVVTYGNQRGLDRIDWYLIVNFQKALDEFEAHQRQGRFMMLEEHFLSDPLLHPQRLWPYLAANYGPDGTGDIDRFIFQFLLPEGAQTAVDKLNQNLRPLAVSFPAGATEAWQNELFRALLD